MFRLAEDIVMYAEGGARPQQKGITYIVRSDPRAVVNKKVRMARLQYDGNWNPEPGGWQRLANVMHNQDKISVRVQDVRLGQDKLVPTVPATQPSLAEMRKSALARVSAKEIQDTGGDPAKFDALIKAKIAEVQAAIDAGKRFFDIAHLTGTAAFQLTDAQRHELKAFVDGGGILLIDAAGGSSEFADSAETELKTIFGAEADQLDKPLTAEDPLYAAGIEKIETFQYRRFAQTKLGLSHDPRLRGIARAGRLVVIFSREDISAGLVGNEVDGITGYEPRTATEIAQSILTYAAH
jgi:hypothetical protein